MRALILSVIAAVALSSPAFGEAAVAKGTDSHGWEVYTFSFNATTQASATAQAMQRCRATATDCSIVTTLRNSCFALAIAIGGYENRYAEESTLDDAFRVALAECTEANPGNRCHIDARFCDTVSENVVSAQNVERAAEAERNRQQQIAAAQDLARQQSDAARARYERETEEQRLRDLRQYADALASCRAYSTYGCDRALAASNLNSADLANLNAWRAVAVTYQSDRESCRTGTLAACDRALASPALPSGDQPNLTEWRTNASPWLKALATVSEFGTSTLDSILSLPATITALPTSTLVMSGIASMLALSLGAVLYRSRASTAPTPAPAAVPQTEATPPQEPAEPSTPDQDEPASAQNIVAEAVPPAPSPQLPAVIPTPPQALTPVPQEQAAIDTPAALRAMRLAAAYLAEVGEHTSYADEQDAKTVRTTLALAAKQLDIARKADPNAVLEAEDLRVTQAEIRGDVLLREAQSWFPHNQSKAIAIMQRAKQANPDSSAIWYWSGWFNYHQRNRDAAISDFERTLSLDPDHIEAMKDLDRAQNLGGAEIALFKVANARDKTIIAAGKTWNIVRIPIYIALLPVRAFFFVLTTALGNRK